MAPFHSLALCCWLILAVLPSLLTANPLYLAATLAFTVGTHQRVARFSSTALAWGSFARFALFFVLFTLLFNVLLGTGGDTVLVELPAWQVTNDQGLTVFQVGGPITAEGLVFGLVRALALLTVIYALATFNALVDHAQLLRGLPRWLDQAATIISIAIAFMPQLVAAQRDVREALALRGHRLRTLRDFLPLIMILLTEALERAMSLAESMEARGYSGPPPPNKETIGPRVRIALGLLLLGSGLVIADLASAPATAEAGGGFPPWLVALRWLGLPGALLILLALRQVAKRGRRSRYRQEVWRPRDTALGATSMVGAAILLGLFFTQPDRLHYWPLTELQLPPVSPWALLPAALCLSPWVLHPDRGSEPVQ